MKLWDLGSGRCSSTLFEDPACVIRDVALHETGSSALAMVLGGAKGDDIRSWDLVGSGMLLSPRPSTVQGETIARRCWSTAEHLHRMFTSADLSAVTLVSHEEGELDGTVRVWRACASEKPGMHPGGTDLVSEAISGFWRS